MQKLYLKNWQSYFYFQVGRNRRDILIVSILAIIAGLTSYLSAQLIDPYFFNKDAIDVWFQSDLSRIFANMTNRGSNHYRTKVHPLFSLIAFPLVRLLIKILNLEPIIAIRIIIAVVAALWISALFVVLRLIGCRRLDAILFSLLGAISAAAVFWFSVPETYSFGSLTILLTLGFVALTQHRQFSPLWYVVVSATTLSITVTNWMVGILATIVNHSWKRTLTITIAALLLVLSLAFVQSYFFPSAQLPFFSKNAIQEEFYFLMRPESGGPLQVLKSFISHTMVMPAIAVTDYAGQVVYPQMLTQPSSPGSGSFWGAVAVGLWLALLSLGLWGLFSLDFLQKSGNREQGTGNRKKN